MSKSRIFLALMLAFVGGVGLRSFVFVGDFYILLGFGVVAAVLLGVSRERRVVLYAAMAAVVFAGMFWYGVREPDTLALERYAGEAVTWEGRVVRDPEALNTGQRLVVSFPEAPRERVLVTTARYPEFSYGDAVRVSGNFARPEPIEDFDYPAYLAKDGIYFTLRFADVALVQEGSGFARGLFVFKERFQNNINAALAFPQSAYVNGVLLGDTSEFPQELEDAFRTAGVSHITALSGYNITVMLVFIGLVLSYVFPSRIAVFFSSVAVVAAFVVMTGASPSVVRAALMGLALLSAQFFGRKGAALNILVFAAFVMIAVNPKVLAFDVGFQLSFLAVLGLAYIAPWLQERLRFVPEVFTLKETLASTLSAQAAVLPLLLYQFHQVSLVAPLANILVLPAIPFVMLFGFLTGALGFVSSVLAQLAGYPLWALTSYQLFVIDLSSHIPYAAFSF